MKRETGRRARASGPGGEGRPGGAWPRFSPYRGTESAISRLISPLAREPPPINNGSENPGSGELRMGTQPNGLKVHNLPTTRSTQASCLCMVLNTTVDAPRSRPAPKAKGLAGHPPHSQKNRPPGPLSVMV